MNTIRHTLQPALALVALLGAGRVAAQQHGQGMGQMGGMMPGMDQHMGEMALIHAYDPAALLEKASELSLTKEQVTKLEALAADTKAGKEKAHAQHNTHHEQLATVFKQATPDPTRVAEHARAAMQAMADAHGAELAVFAKAKGLLTDEQRAKVDARVTEHGKHQGAGEKHDGQ